MSLWRCCVIRAFDIILSWFPVRIIIILIYIIDEVISSILLYCILALRVLDSYLIFTCARLSQTRLKLSSLFFFITVLLHVILWVIMLFFILNCHMRIQKHFVHYSPYMCLWLRPCPLIKPVNYLTVSCSSMGFSKSPWLNIYLVPAGKKCGSHMGFWVGAVGPM